MLARMQQTAGLVFFAWGEIYSLFPSTVGDSYGSKFAATNAGLLYTAKGTASLLVPLTSVITSATGGWHTVFYIAAAMNALAAVMAIAVLKPMRRAQAIADFGARPTLDYFEARPIPHG